MEPTKEQLSIHLKEACLHIAPRIEVCQGLQSNQRERLTVYEFSANEQ